MRKYKIEDKRLDAKPTMYITLHEGPYTKERILNKTGWLTKIVSSQNLNNIEL